MSRKTWTILSVFTLMTITIPLILSTIGKSPDQQDNRVGGISSNNVLAATAGGNYLPFIVNPQSTPTLTKTTAPSITPTKLPIFTQTAGPTQAPVNSPILESFEGLESSWQVFRDISGNANLTRSNAKAKDGAYSVLASSSGAGTSAQIRKNFVEPVLLWKKRPGNWFWQQSSVYLPSSTVNLLGPNDYFTIGGLWPSAGGQFGWWLRIRQGGKLFVYGYDKERNAWEFPVYGTFPQDQWVELTLGLHSENDAGTKRGFSFLLNGDFYGWYNQGNWEGETYDRAAIGILDTNSPAALQVYVDAWRNSTTGQFPTGPDNRSTANLQEQDFRNMSGVQWEIDWATWKLDLRLHPTFGLYSTVERVQAGRNLDRMPSLVNGWAEIEIDWPKGQPPIDPTSWFGPMVAFRKDKGWEENLEIIPVGKGGGAVDLVFEAWVNGGPVELAKWPLPRASAGNSHIPEPGDIIRVRWEQINSTQLSVRVSYFDASSDNWNSDVINISPDISNIGGVNFTDGYHLISSITIDSPYYSIRRFKVGTLPTYPN